MNEESGHNMIIQNAIRPTEGVYTVLKEFFFLAQWQRFENMVYPLRSQGTLTWVVRGFVFSLTEVYTWHTVNAHIQILQGD